MKAHKILLVDDDANDVELALASLHKHHVANEVLGLRDGSEVLDYLYHRGSFAATDDGTPIVILLDLKMPKVGGLEVLRQLKSDPALKSIPVVVLTSSNEAADLREAYQLGANSYVVKPVDFGKFAATLEQLGLYWVVTNQPPPHTP